MKKILLVILLLCSTTAFSQNTVIIPTPQINELMDGCFILKEPFLFVCDDTNPDVQKIVNDFKFEMKDMLGNKIVLSEKVKRKYPAVVFEIVDDIGVDKFEEQAYILDVAENVITLKATHCQGLFYATRSLKQLVRYAVMESDIPAIQCQHIVDWPDLEYRGWMDDISRGPVPTVDYLKKVITTLADYKMNFFNLYTEHLFKLESYPDIAPADGFTTSQIQELADFANGYYVDFMGNQQCFAHAEEILCNPLYHNIMDTKYNFNPAVDVTYEFFENVFSEVVPAYQSRFFNINCDETEGLGGGRAAAYVDSVGQETAYCRHINRIYGILKKYDKEVLMWGDIISKTPEHIKDLPADMQYIVWSYVPSDDFSAMIKPFKDSGSVFWTASGACMWATAFPDIKSYMKNIANLARDAAAYGSKGLMNTAWDDAGESLFMSALHSMVWTAEMTWHALNPLSSQSESERLNRETHFNELFNIHYFNSMNYDYVADIYAVADLCHNTETSKLMNFNALYEAFLEFYPDQVDSAAFQRFTLARDLSDEIYSRLSSDIEKLQVNSELLECAAVAAYRVYATATKNLLKIQLYNTLNNPTQQNIDLVNRGTDDFIEIIRHLKYSYLRLWDKECRAYSRDFVTARYDRMINELLHADEKVFIENEGVIDGYPVVALRTVFNDRTIYYTLDGSLPDGNSLVYKDPVRITQSGLLRAVSYDGNTCSDVNERFMLYHKAVGRLKKLNSSVGDYRSEYSGGGEDALLNGIIGSNDYKDGNWQGFYNQDLDIEIDLGKKMIVNELNVNFMTNPYDWIMMPRFMEIYTSSNGSQFKLWKTYKFDDEVPQNGNTIVNKSLSVNTKTRYLRVVVKNPGIIPEGLPGHGYPSWLFVDELIVN